MAGVSALISSLINLAANLLPEVKNTFFAASSSSSAQAPDAHTLEADLKRLMRMLERIKATLYDAEDKNIRDKSVKLWLKELRGLAHEAEFFLDEYMYEVYRAQVVARNASELNPIKGDPEQSVVYTVQISHDMVDHIRDIKSRFEEIAYDREALCLREEDAPNMPYNKRRPPPTSPLVVEQSIFGREEEKKKVINLLISDYSQKEAVSVLPIVGKGGLGKTTLAQQVYNDKKVQDRFDMLGWVCVSDDFNIERISRDIIECITRAGCNIKNPSVLMEILANKIRGKRIFLVLDDVWNEEPGLWELIRTPLMLAKKAIILVTTRNVSVARIMQTMGPLMLEYLSENKCWLLFTHYAFQGIDPAKQSSLVEIGKEICKRCGGLPLAVKLIASLLRHEAEAQSWMDILDSELWELDAGKEILAPLQISYERLPMYLKPCLLLCSMFPKDYDYDVGLMSRLWIANGYIESKERKHPEEGAIDYAKELHERSFFDDYRTTYNEDDTTNWNRGLGAATFRLHDMVHDLVWLNSENTCYSVERYITKEVRHFYLDNKLKGPEFLGSINIPVLQTLVMRFSRFYANVESKKHTFLSSLPKAVHLRALDFNLLEVMPLSLGHLKHLRYLSVRMGISVDKFSSQFLSSCYSLRMLILKIDFETLEIELEGIGNLINLEFLQINAIHHCIKLPESLGFLKKLRVLEIDEVAELPECIGNLEELHRIIITCTELTKLPDSFCKLTNLEVLILNSCYALEELPKDFGNLTRLQFLLLQGPKIQYLPLSCTKFVPRCTMNVCDIRSQPDNIIGALGWLKDFNNLKGDLWIKDLCKISSLADVENANIVSKHNLKTLLLDWNDIFSIHTDLYGNEYVIPRVYSEQEGILGISICNSKNYKSLNAQDYQILEIFQPHRNLKHLYIGSYGGLEFPNWMGDPLSCASLVKLCIRSCPCIRFLPLGNVVSLKYLHIYDCGRLVHLKKASLPLQLKHLTVGKCHSLLQVVLQESLVNLHIYDCYRLEVLLKEDVQILDLKVFQSLKKVTIEYCPFVGTNQLLLRQDCNVHIDGCPNLKDWCLKHNFHYMDTYNYYDDEDGIFYSEDDDDKHLDGIFYREDDDDRQFVNKKKLRWGALRKLTRRIFMC